MPGRLNGRFDAVPKPWHRASGKSFPEIGTIVHLSVSVVGSTFFDDLSIENATDIVGHLFSNLRRIRHILANTFCIVLVGFPVSVGAPVRQLP